MATAVRDHLDNIDPGKMGRTPTVEHSSQCSICRHPECEAMEIQYLRGLPMTATAQFFSTEEVPVDRVCFGRHVAARDLSPHRTRTTLTLLDAMIDSASEDSLRVTTQNVAALMQTRAKLTGELVEKMELQFTGSVEISTAIDTARKNLTTQLGLGLRPGMMALPMSMKTLMEAHALAHPEFDITAILFVEEPHEDVDGDTTAAGDPIGEPMAGRVPGEPERKNDWRDNGPTIDNESGRHGESDPSMEAGGEDDVQ